MNRKAALTTIRAEYAKHGKPTQASTRAYIENRIGFGTFTDAKKAGMWIYRQAQIATRVCQEAHNDEDR